MASTGMGLQILMFVMMINFMFYLIGGTTGVWETIGTDENFIADNMDIAFDRDNPSGNLTTNTNNTYGIEGTAGSSSSVFGFVVDYWAKITGFFQVIFQFLFAPYHIMNSTGAPSVISYPLFMLWTILYITAIAQFILGRTF